MHAVPRIWVIAPAGKSCPMPGGLKITDAAPVRIAKTPYAARRLMAGDLFRTNDPAAPTAAAPSSSAKAS